MRVPTSSALPLVKICAASWALPHDRSVNDRARMGDALHEHMQLRAELGVGEAMALLGELVERHELTERETGIFVARCRSFEWCPPANAFGEVGLALLEDGSVVRVKGAKGQYDLPPTAITAGTLDVMWSEPAPLDVTDPGHPRCPPGSMLWVVDYKSGDDAFVEPIEHNAQAGTNALLAARWTGASVVVPAILFIRKGLGEWDTPAEAWSMADLERHERELRGWLEAAREQQRRAAAFEPLALVEGKHCEFCPGRSRCSAHTAILRTVADGSRPVPQGDAPLTETEAVWIADHLRAIEGFAKRARSGLVAHVNASGAIPMSDGNWWGPHLRRRTSIVVKEAFRVLVEELGDEGANDAIEIETSVTRDSIEDVVKAQHAAQGIKRQVAPTVRRIFAKLGEAGALVVDDEIQYGAHKPQDPPEDLEGMLEAAVDRRRTG